MQEKVVFDDIYCDTVSGKVMRVYVLFVHIVNDIHGHKKIKKIAAHPHAMKASKCLRNRLFYYHGLKIKRI